MRIHHAGGCASPVFVTGAAHSPTRGDVADVRASLDPIWTIGQSLKKLSYGLMDSGPTLHTRPPGAAMIRRILTLAASLALTTTAAVALATPAQAAVVDLTFGPLSIGDYCAAKVSSTAWIGFYESTGLRCYRSGPTGGLQFAGYGDPYLACKHLTIDVVMAGLRGPSDALVCRVIR